MQPQENKPDLITRSKVNEFKKSLSVGQALFIKIEATEAYDKETGARAKKIYKKQIATVEKKYPFLVQTDRGTFQYAELLMAVERYKGVINE